MTDNDLHEIKQAIEKAYIRGIHEEQNRALIDEGFHPAFDMIVLDESGVSRVNVEEWLPRIEDLKEANPEMWAANTTCEFKLVDVAGKAAVAKFDVYKGDEFFSVDYMLLCKVRTRWQIVSKVFLL